MMKLELGVLSCNLILPAVIFLTFRLIDWSTVISRLFMVYMGVNPIKLLYHLWRWVAKRILIEHIITPMLMLKMKAVSSWSLRSDAWIFSLLRSLMALKVITSVRRFRSQTRLFVSLKYGRLIAAFTSCVVSQCPGLHSVTFRDSCVKITGLNEPWIISEIS
jgi:hypothetical protein